MVPLMIGPKLSALCLYHYHSCAPVLQFHPLRVFFDILMAEMMLCPIISPGYSTCNPDYYELVYSLGICVLIVLHIVY